MQRIVFLQVIDGCPPATTRATVALTPSEPILVSKGAAHLERPYAICLPGLESCSFQGATFPYPAGLP